MLQIPELYKSQRIYFPVPGGSGGCVSIQQLSVKKESTFDHTLLNLASSSSMLSGFENKFSCVIMIKVFGWLMAAFRQHYCLLAKHHHHDIILKTHYVKDRIVYVKLNIADVLISQVSSAMNK